MELAGASLHGDTNTQWKLCRNSVRPASRVDATAEHTLLQRGLDGYDVTSLAQLLRKDKALGLSSYLQQHHPAVQDSIGGTPTDPRHLAEQHPLPPDGRPTEDGCVQLALRQVPQDFYLFLI